MLITNVLALVLAAMSQTIELAPPSGQGLDTTIIESDPNTAFGPGTGLSVSGAASPDTYRVLVGFDLTGAMYGLEGIPAGSKIVSATLRLNCTSAALSPESVSVHLLKQGTSIVSPETTWNVSAVGVPWLTPGGDYVRTASLTFLAPTVEGFFDIEGLVDAAQDSLDLNDGNLTLLIRATTENSADCTFVVSSSETPYEPIGNRPRLILEYLPAAMLENPPATPPTDAEAVRDVQTVAGWGEDVGDSRAYRSNIPTDP